MSGLTTATITRVLTENSARFHPKVIVYEGLGHCWGAMRHALLPELERLGWWREGNKWTPPVGKEFDLAYAELCEAVPPAPGMTRENMQPIAEGSYPEGEIWFEQFGSYPELRVEGDALAYYEAPMTPMQHVRLLKDRAEAMRLSALSAGKPGTSSAWELEERADEIGRENGLPRAAAEPSFRADRVQYYGGAVSPKK